MEKRVNWEQQVNWKIPSDYLDLSHGMKVNEFADLTTSEFVSEYTGYKPIFCGVVVKQLGTHEYVDEPLDQMKPGTCFQLNVEGPSSFFLRLESELSETLLFFILVS